MSNVKRLKFCPSILFFINAPDLAVSHRHFFLIESTAQSRKRTGKPKEFLLASAFFQKLYPVASHWHKSLSLRIAANQILGDTLLKIGMQFESCEPTFSLLFCGIGCRNPVGYECMWLDFTQKFDEHINPSHKYDYRQLKHNIRIRRIAVFKSSQPLSLMSWETER